MTNLVKIDPTATGESLITGEAISFADLMNSAEMTDALLSEIEAWVRSEHTTTDTKAGRDNITSLAYRVSRTKTLIEGKGKEASDQIKKQAEGIDKNRKTVTARLDALRDEVKAPLLEWEAQDQRRKAALAQMLEALKPVATGPHDSTAFLQQDIARLEAIDLSAIEDQDARGEMDLIRKASIANLSSWNTEAEAREEAEAKEAEARRIEQEELAELRAEKAKRAAEDAARQKAEQDKADLENRAATARAYILDCAKGEIGGRKVSAEIIIHQLESVIPERLADLGQRGADLIDLASATLAAVKAGHEEEQRQAAEKARADQEARAAQIKAEAEAEAKKKAEAEAENTRRAEAEAQKAREDNARIRAKAQRDIAASLEAGGIEAEAATLSASLIVAGKVARLKVEF